MGVTKTLVIAAVTLSVSGCGILGIGDRRGGLFGGGSLFGDGGASEQGLPFRANLSSGADPRNFTVRVRAEGSNVPAVRESTRFQATRYCLDTFGRSDAVWQIDPVSNDWAFTRNGNDMVFTGRCTAR